jgi:hypothetical protein
MGYAGQDGRWHSEHVSNAELGTTSLPTDSGRLAETFDATIWGGDAGRAVAEPLLVACRDGVFPESLTLLRTCFHVQSRVVRVATQDGHAADDVALLDRLAAAVRQRATDGGSDEIEATVVAQRLTMGQAITTKVYEDPGSRRPRSLLAGLMLQATTALRHPIENQMSEVVAFLVDRDDAFARGFLALCAGGTDTQLEDAVAATKSIGARTQISLPAAGPAGMPQRTTLFPDISIDGSDQAFQVLVEVKVDAMPHTTVIAGESFEQPNAYVHAWRRLREPEPARVRRVCTLTREHLDGGAADPWRGASVSWHAVANLLKGQAAVAIAAELALVAEELAALINTVVYPAIDPAELAYVIEVGPSILDAFVSEIQRAHPAAMASASRIQRDYIGRHLTLAVAGDELRLWLYATPAGGRYNLPGRDASIVWAIADDYQTTPWLPERIEQAAGSIGLKLERDIAGYRRFSQYFALPPDLNAARAAEYGRSLAAKIADLPDL